MYATAGEPGNKDFDFTLIDAMNGDRDSVSFQSVQNQKNYIPCIKNLPHLIFVDKRNINVCQVLKGRYHIYRFFVCGSQSNF